MFLWRSSNKALLLAALARWFERRAGFSRRR
jgi:hypothetical protein